MYIVFDFVITDVFILKYETMMFTEDIPSELSDVDKRFLEINDYTYQNIDNHFFCIKVNTNFKEKMLSQRILPEIVEEIYKCVKNFTRKEKLNKLGCI